MLHRERITTGTTTTKEIENRTEQNRTVHTFQYEHVLQSRGDTLVRLAERAVHVNTCLLLPPTTFAKSHPVLSRCTLLHVHLTYLDS